MRQVEQVMFTGEYRHAIDGKGRLAVPARFRARLDGGAYVAQWIDGCLGLFPRAAFEALAERVAARPVTDANARAFARAVFAGAFEVELDGQGRILLPAGLRTWAGIAGEAIVVGAVERVELWAPGRWTAYRAAQAVDEPDIFAQRLQDLGI
ncbi:MAG: division/cell wall cluster transcriptional repressor MraZ [Candidatus Limnocylindrales bacterium]